MLIQQEELGMAGRKRFRDDQNLERRDMTEDQKRMKAESKSSVSSEVASCPRETESHRSAPLEGDEGDDSGSSAYSTEWLESLMLSSQYSLNIMRNQSGRPRRYSKGWLQVRRLGKLRSTYVCGA